MINSLKLILLLFMLPAFAGAQDNPHSLVYSTVVKYKDGNPVLNKAVTVRISLHERSETGRLLYQEIYTPVTDGTGKISLNIGSGTQLRGNYASINWAESSRFLQVEIDATGLGTEFILVENKLISK